ncbi:MAG TPA: AraC family transcriptional regulator [Longimicrobium sp.]|nr:AraC family transcriptional regulator [Longimicrobium sp.]
MGKELQARPADARVHPSVRRARDYLEAHPTARVPLDELARAALMSKFHLVRRFKAALGVTPGQYQLLLRLAHARTLLERGHPVSWVAYETGFADQSHLTRSFRETYGMTPGRFAALAGSEPGDVPRAVDVGAPPMTHPPLAAVA